MQPTPPLDPNQYDLAELLARSGRTFDWLNTDDGDPYSEPNVARFSIVDATKITPFHYRSALVTEPALRAWVGSLIADARRDQAARRAVMASISNGPSLMLLGSTGVGKTHQAYGAVRELAVSGVLGRWVATTAADMYGALRPRHGVDSEAEFSRYRSARILLVDDLGAERKPTEFTEEINFRLVNHRYQHHLPTLFTSNLLPKDLAGRLGDRVTSRIAEMTERVVIEGADRRRDTGTGEAA